MELFLWPLNISTDLTTVSHTASNFRVEDGVMKCDIRVLDTPLGKQLASMIEDGSVVFRSAGHGTLVQREDGVNEVTNFTLTQIGAIPRGDDPYITQENAYS